MTLFAQTKFDKFTHRPVFRCSRFQWLPHGPCRTACGRSCYSTELPSKNCSASAGKRWIKTLSCAPFNNRRKMVTNRHWPNHKALTGALTSRRKSRSDFGELLGFLSENCLAWTVFVLNFRHQKNHSVTETQWNSLAEQFEKFTNSMWTSQCEFQFWAFLKTARSFCSEHRLSQPSFQCILWKLYF